MNPIQPQTQDQTFWLIKAFHDGGPAMFFIALVGILVVLLILERFATLKRLTVDKNDFVRNLESAVVKGDVRQAITYCDARPTPLTLTIKAGLIQVLNGRSDEEVQVAMDGAVLRETPRLEGWTGFLAVFGNVATLIGLLGTIIGLIISFGSIAEADPAQKATELSRGISHALNCTAFGLTVAIVALVAYGYFQTVIGRRVNEMIESSMTLMNLVVANRDKFKV